jgi:hypothetical protein
MVKKRGDKNKNHVEYSCEICLKKFLQKIDLIRHNNKIKPCIKKNNFIKIENLNNNNLDKNDNDLNGYSNDLNGYSSEDEKLDFDEKTNFNEILNYKSDDDKIYNIDDNNDDFNIEKPNYNNILGGGIDDNENINNDILDNNNIVFELMKKMDFIIKQNEEFKKQNEKMNNDILKLNDEIVILKEDNENLKNQLILSTETNKNDIKTFINVNIQINNFNDVDYSKMNPKNLIKTLIKEQGKQIFLKTIKDIFINPEKPENHNIYIADKNRKYVKVYNDKKWITDDFKIIDKIIENIVNVYKLSIEEIKKDNQLYEKIKKSIQDKMKYLNYCNPEYLAELEYEQENDDIDNKDEIKRSKNFYEMVYNDIINLLHDNKNIILNTHKNNILTT